VKGQIVLRTMSWRSTGVLAHDKNAMGLRQAKRAQIRGKEGQGTVQQSKLYPFNIAGQRRERTAVWWC